MTKQRKKLLEIIPKWAQQLAAFITACGIIVGAISATIGKIQAAATADLRNDIDQLSQDVASIKLDTTRMQLLTLMTEDSDNVTDILKVAKYYFQDLHGDWYMSRMFSDWAEQHNIDVSDLVKITEK